MVVDLQHREGLAGDVVRAGLLGVHAQGGQGEHHEDADAGDERDDGAAHDVAEDEAPDAESRSSRLRRRSSGRRLLWTRSPSFASTAGSTVSEPSTATPTTRIEPIAIAPLSGSPRKKMPASEAITVRPETRTAWPLVAAAASSAASLPAPARPLLALALEVEERVVDGHGHADQHHQDLRALAGRHELARDGGQPEGGEHRGQPEQHRDAGREQRAEGQQQDEQGDRDREELRLLEVLRELVVELLAR